MGASSAALATTKAGVMQQVRVPKAHARSKQVADAAQAGRGKQPGRGGHQCRRPFSPLPPPPAASPGGRHSHSPQTPPPTHQTSVSLTCECTAAVHSIGREGWMVGTGARDDAAAGALLLADWGRQRGAVSSPP